MTSIENDVNASHFAYATDFLAESEVLAEELVSTLLNDLQKRVVSSENSEILGKSGWVSRLSVMRGDEITEAFRVYFNLIADSFEDAKLIGDEITANALVRANVTMAADDDDALFLQAHAGERIVTREETTVELIVKVNPRDVVSVSRDMF